MKNSRIFSAPQLVGLCSLLACLALAGPVFAQSPETVQSFRSKFNLILDNYEVVLQRMGSARGQTLVNDAKQSMQAVTDDQLSALFAKSGVPDLSEAADKVGNLLLLSGTVTPASPVPLTPGFPDAPPILADCNNIAHDPGFTFGALVAFEVLRTVLAAAEFVCVEVILGEDGAAACVPLAIAADAAEIPFELADFCGGEENSSLIQGSFDRLDHIHNDLDLARTAITDNINTSTSSIINNANTNTSAIITNDNTNTTSIITNDNTNTSAIITNDNTNTTSIITNGNANKDAIINELHALGCEIVRLLNTPEGQRASSILSCTGQPGFPYKWPQK